MMRYKWTVEIEVDSSWVADGFTLDNDRAHDMVAKTLPYAYGHEFTAKVLRAPTPGLVKAVQGYEFIKNGVARSIS